QRAVARLEARMSRRRSARTGRPRRRAPTLLRAIGWLGLHIGSLLLVTWRQTHGLELESALRSIETAKEMAGAEKVRHEQNIQRLQSRARVVQVARDRLGMRLAVGDEIVFLPAVAAAPAAPSASDDRQDLGHVRSLIAR